MEAPGLNRKGLCAFVNRQTGKPSHSVPAELDGFCLKHYDNRVVRELEKAAKANPNLTVHYEASRAKLVQARAEKKAALARERHVLATAREAAALRANGINKSPQGFKTSDDQSHTDKTRLATEGEIEKIEPNEAAHNNSAVPENGEVEGLVVPTVTPAQSDAKDNSA
jgi:hypothetical protein